MTQGVKSVKKPKHFTVVLMCAKIIGIFPCKITDTKIKSGKNCDYFYCLLWAMYHITYTSLAYCDIRTSILFPNRGYRTFAYILKFSLNIISVLAYIIVAVFKQRNFLKFFAKLECYDDQAKFINNDKLNQFGFIPWVLLLFTVIIIEMTTADILKISKSSEITIARVISYITPLFINTCCVFLHGIFVYLLLQRFKHLNKVITFKSRNPTAKIDRPNVTEPEVRLLYGILFDSVKELNKAYGFATLIFYLSSIINLLVSIHGLIYYGTEINITLIVIALLQIVPLSTVCHFTAKQAKQIREWVTDRECTFKSYLNGMENLETMLYYYNKPVFFTVGYFFHINYSLLLAIGSTLLTYLVILIQLS